MALQPLAVPASARAAAANAALNDLTWVTVHEAAAGATTEEAELLEVAEASWSHPRDRGWHAATRRAHRVQVVALDDLVDRGRIAAPAVVKIDVEGSELRGMRRTLARHRPIVICELHGTNEELLELLADHDLENLDGPGDVLSSGAVHVLARART